jgi:predicted MFS family arabinose efflux permease
VLFGAVFGAILGPAVFSPLLAGGDLDGDALATLWLAAGGFMVIGLVLVLAVRPDPRRIATLLHHSDQPDTSTAAPLSELLRRRGVIPALLAAQASFAVMVGVMTLTGAIVVDHYHHEAHHVFPIIGAHVIGMYALVIVVGDLIDRIGRTPSLAGGLIAMAVSVISLLWIESAAATAIALFGLGLGWNLSFVAATAELADRTAPSERGKLLGFNDLLSGLTGAALALLGGIGAVLGPQTLVISIAAGVRAASIDRARQVVIGDDGSEEEYDALALATGSAVIGIAGFALMGAGLAGLFPLALNAAGETGGPAAPALAAVA